MDCTGRVTEYRYCGLLSFAASSHPCKPFGPLPNPAMATCIQPALPLPTSQGQQIALNPRQWCGRFMICSNVVQYVVIRYQVCTETPKRPFVVTPQNPTARFSSPPCVTIQ
ncbi:uncharacterized protein CLUP02_11171 [Colletotrichum lupini]|uniref:Uncharacterized protein n=1 Tax=Colletotrichum lupini TaxID=145971 RepID=A0A9Q8WK20_9PEZI|nr:uncharacterized protein CLUP02_11171 [Colletotrichum lupini]KAK1716278.1 hypothetical protein BDP67DRAFT_509328 [Colletotrichum lupini]UQC85672.1 hypothetical protein CLUP02_11171 [Colletotrichum lupini]